MSGAFIQTGQPLRDVNLNLKYLTLTDLGACAERPVVVLSGLGKKQNQIGTRQYQSGNLI
jgi:hypothetical protein